MLRPLLIILIFQIFDYTGAFAQPSKIKPKQINKTTKKGGDLINKENIYLYRNYFRFKKKICFRPKNVLFNNSILTFYGKSNVKIQDTYYKNTDNGFWGVEPNYSVTVKGKMHFFQFEKMILTQVENEANFTIIQLSGKRKALVSNSQTELLFFDVEKMTDSSCWEWDESLKDSSNYCEGFGPATIEYPNLGDFQMRDVKNQGVSLLITQYGKFEAFLFLSNGTGIYFELDSIIAEEENEETEREPFEFGITDFSTLIETYLPYHVFDSHAVGQIKISDTESFTLLQGDSIKLEKLTPKNPK